MATTYGAVQDEILETLHSQSMDTEQQTELTSGIGASDLTLNVLDASQISRGLIEIDSELLWVSSVDQTNNIVTIAGYGRGYRSSTATTHVAATAVVNNPRWPRTSVKTAIQEAVQGVYPDLYVVKSDETQTSVSVVMTYPLPADTDWIIRVEWQSIGPSKRWVPVRRWNYDPKADSTAFTTGKSLDIFDSMVPGRTIKVTYAAAPIALAADSDTLDSIGFNDGMRDVLVFGAVARLLASAEASRLQTNAVEQSERSLLVQPGAATAASRGYFALYQQRLNDEIRQLQRSYPATTHFTR